MRVPITMVVVALLVASCSGSPHLASSSGTSTSTTSTTSTSTTSPTVPPSTTAPPTTLITPAATGPTQAAIAATMRRTVEVSDPSTYFKPNGLIATTHDASGGLLTAAVGTRYPTADAAGQLVFFWHGTTFIGWDSRFETRFVTALKSGGTGVFSVSYANYGPNDPLCCPSRPPLTITYRWNGQGLTPSRTPTTGAGTEVRLS